MVPETAKSDLDASSRSVVNHTAQLGDEETCWYPSSGSVDVGAAAEQAAKIALAATATVSEATRPSVMI